jgi:hypothetical protein
MNSPGLRAGAGLDVAAMGRQHRQAPCRGRAEQPLGQPRRLLRPAPGEVGLDRRVQRRRGLACGRHDARQPRRPRVRRSAPAVDALGDRVEREALGRQADEHLAPDGAAEGV